MRISDWSSDVCSSDLMINNPAYADGNGAPERLVVSGAGLSLATPGGIITDTALRGTVFGPGGAVGQFDYGTVSNPWMIGGDWESTQGNRSEERRVGKECVRQGRARGLTYY